MAAVLKSPGAQMNTDINVITLSLKRKNLEEDNFETIFAFLIKSAPVVGYFWYCCDSIKLCEGLDAKTK